MSKLETLTAVLPECRAPRALGQREDRGLHRFEHVEPDQKPDLGVLRCLAELRGGTGGVDAHNDLSAEVGDDVERELLERLLEDLDLGLGAVSGGVPGRSIPASASRLSSRYASSG